MLCTCGALLLTAGAMFCQPVIGQNGVVNTASRIPPSLAGGSIGRGSLFSISGVRFAGRTRVTLQANGVNVEAKVLKVGATSIDAWMPVSAPTGPASLIVTSGIVTSGEKASRPFSIEIGSYNPGLFSRNGQGWGPALAENVEASGSRTANTPAHPARPGQRVVLGATGLAGAKEVSVVVGNLMSTAIPAATKTQGRDEIAIAIPADAPPGCWVPVYILVTRARASNVVTLSIGPSGTPCAEGPIPGGASRKVGIVALSRTEVRTFRKTVLVQEQPTVLEDLRATFIATGAEPELTPLGLLPPPGSCTAYTASFQANAALAASIVSIVSPEGRGLDSGQSLTLTRADQSRSISRGFETPGRYRARLGGSGAPGVKTLPLFLLPGEYLLKSPGGKDVGGFTARFRLPEPFRWTDRDRNARVDRARGVTVHWSGASPDDTVLILARNVDQVATSIGMSLCTARGEPDQFTIPPAILANLPASSDSPGESYDELAVAALAVRGPIQAPGLNSGFVLSVFVSERFVRFE
jgi:uncharacterized protein (TIGR03437 family)